MNTERQNLTIGFLSTYPPRECGIATFTQDLVQALKRSRRFKIEVAAVSDRPYDYGEDVAFQLPQQDRESYEEAARRINRSGVQLLVVEHEYGIYGGECGEYLLELFGRIEKPVVSTFHTVLPEPDQKQKAILRTLCEKSAAVVTMASNSAAVLRGVYGADPDKIRVIPHGVPEFDLPPREQLKREAHLEGRTVVSTFGLISPGKGLEYGIEAIAEATRKHPDIFYLILGRTHPVVKREFGEAYRRSLEKLVADRGLQKNVGFVDRYLTKEELARYLKLSDIYMTPYLGRDQAVSGTLAYAVGYGRAVVSTPYLYAQEVLADGRGMLAEFRDAGSLAGCIGYLAEHPEEKARMEQKAARYGKAMTWPRVAEQYGETFFSVLRRFSAQGGGSR